MHTGPVAGANFGADCSRDRLGITGIGEAGLQRRWHAVEGAVQHMRRWLIGKGGAYRVPVAAHVPRRLLPR